MSSREGEKLGGGGGGRVGGGEKTSMLSREGERMERGG